VGRKGGKRKPAPGPGREVKVLFGRLSKRKKKKKKERKTISLEYEL